MVKGTDDRQRLRVERTRLLLMFGTLLVMVVIAVGVALSVFYHNDHSREQARFAALAEGYAHALLALYQAEKHHVGSPPAALANLLVWLHDHSGLWQEGLGRSGEILLVRREGERIHFVFRYSRGETALPGPLPWRTEEPLASQRALEGGAGVMLTPDYRGIEVLAAYHFLEPLNLGLVVKVDLDEMREPLREALTEALLAALLAILVGALFLSRFSEGVIRRLRESEERFRTLFEAAPDAIFLADAHSGVVLDANPAATRLLGKSLSSLQGLHQSQLHPPEMENYVREAFVAHAARVSTLPGKPVPAAVHHADGHVIPVEISVARTSLAGQAVLMGLFRDITERSRIATELAELLELNRKIITESPSGIIAYKAAGPCVLANATAAASLGASVPQLLAQNFREIDAWRRYGLLETALQALASGQTLCLDKQIISTFGRHARLEYYFTPFTSSGETHLLLQIRDVTCERQAQEALRESEARFRALFESMQDGLLLCQPLLDEAGGVTDGEVLAANPAFAQLADSHWQGQRLSALFPMAMAADRWPVRLLADALAGAVPRLEAYCPEFARHLQVSAYLAEPSRVALLFRDITQQRQQEAQLRQSQKLEAIGTLAGGIAHDFNNILGVILGFTELVLKKLPPEDQRHLDLREVYQAGLRARDLVAQLLAFSRQTDFQQRPLLLEPLVKEVMKFLQAILPATVEIILQLRAGQAQVLGDPTQVHQILMNLCTNAAQALEGRPGVLTVALEEVALAADNPLHLPAGSHALLSVHDTGPGIAPEILPRIFDPFFTTKGTGQGTGLGLSVVHGLVTAAKGAVAVDTQPDQGSTFRVYLPLLQGATAAAAYGEPGKMRRFHYRVLLVDDDAPLLAMTQEQLQLLGCRVTACTQAEAALERLRLKSYDLVITDLTMPQATGQDVLQAVRRLHPTLPVVLTSGHQVEKVEELGFSGFLRKPVLLEELTAVLRRLQRS